MNAIEYKQYFLQSLIAELLQFDKRLEQVSLVDIESIYDKVTAKIKQHLNTSAKVWLDNVTTFFEQLTKNIRAILHKSAFNYMNTKLTSNDDKCKLYEQFFISLANIILGEVKDDG